MKSKKNLKNKEEDNVNLLNDLQNDEQQNQKQDQNVNIKANVDEEVRKAFMERDEHDRKNNIVRLKLPEKYMTDDDGRPVILTPEVIENIQGHTQQQNKQQQKILKNKKLKHQMKNQII